MEAVEIVPIDESQIARCAAILADSLFDDPLGVYALPDPAIRRNVSGCQLEASVRYGHLYGVALTTAGEPQGVAVWLRPHATEFTRERVEAAGMSTLAGLLGPVATERFARIWKLFHEARLGAVGDNCWYLMVIGVAPACQGRGVGRALVQHVLKRADAEKVPCVVETVQPRNETFYESLGFRAVWKRRDVASGLHLLLFTRQPCEKLPPNPALHPTAAGRDA